MKLPELRRFDWKHRALHLGAVWALSVGKPILDATNESGFILLPRSAAPIDVVLLAVIVLFVPPLVLLGIELLAGLASVSLRNWLHLALIAALLAVLAIQVLGSLGLKDPQTAILLSLLLAGAATFGYATTDFMPATLDVLSPAPVIFLVLYLFFSPATSLWLSDSEPEDVDLKNDPPVVLIVLDEFPTSSLLSTPGRIDGSRYPNFARLADKATWYENATSVADQTTRAVPAIFTGKAPEDDAKPVPTARAYPENLFTLLGHAYDIDAVETATQLCPRDVCEREIRDPFPERFGRIAGDLAIHAPAAVLPKRTHNKVFGSSTAISPLPPKTPDELFDLFVDDIDGQPGHLDVIHAVNLPHKPWRLVPSGESYEDPGVLADDLEGEGVSAGGAASITDRKRHLLQVGAADRLIGRVIDKLEAEGAWDDAMVVVTADHGINFRAPAPRRSVREANLDQIAFVPLFIKRPHQRSGATDSAPVQTIDIVPTIAGALGVDLPWEVDGVPAGERTDPEVAVSNPKGLETRSDLAALRVKQDQFVAEWNKLLATGKGWDALISSGPGAELIGTKVPDQPPDAEGSAEISDFAEDSGPERVNAVIGGTLQGIPPGRRLAVAVNGRIAATTRSFGMGAAITFQAVLPPRVYRSAVGRVQLLRVLSGPRFEQLASSSP